MAKINRKFFFDNVRHYYFEGIHKQSQVYGLTAVLAYCEANYSDMEDRWLAHMPAAVRFIT